MSYLDLEHILLDENGKLVKSNHKYHFLTEGDKEASKSFKDFFDLTDYLARNNICFNPVCTTCGGARLCELAYYIGSIHMNELIEACSIDEMYLRTDLNWHDAMEVLMTRRNKPVYIIESLSLVKAYHKIFSIYNKTKSLYYGQGGSYKARQEVIKKMKERSILDEYEQ